MHALIFWTRHYFFLNFICWPFITWKWFVVVGYEIEKNAKRTRDKHEEYDE